LKKEYKQISLSGTVSAVFAHRFVIEKGGNKYLADIGPEAIDLVALQEGDKVTVKGERKPSEIKVSEIAKGDGKPIRIDHAKKHDQSHAYEDPREALAGVTRQGFVVMAEPRRKPKHFEILGRSANGDLKEFHVEFDGSIRKQKPAEGHDPKWTAIAPTG
jgi:hypothetical protein